MLYFIKKYRVLLFATALLFSGLVILTGTHESRRALGMLDRLALNFTGFFARGLSWVGGGIAGAWDNYVYLVGVRAENETLRTEIDRLRLEQAGLVEAGLEAQRLRRVLAFRERAGFTALPASVIGSDVSGWFRTIIIDRGSRDGVERGMAVITPDGVVGRTLEVSSRASKVLLVTDSNSSVDALVQRTRARGVVAGRVTPLLEMRYVHRTENVRAQDVVITSGVGGLFPKGLPLGVVRAVEETTGLFKTVEVTPAVDFWSLEEVLVVTAYDGRDYEAVLAAERAVTPAPPVPAAAKIGVPGPAAPAIKPGGTSTAPTAPPRLAPPTDHPASPAAAPTAPGGTSPASAAPARLTPPQGQPASPAAASPAARLTPPQGQPASPTAASPAAAPTAPGGTSTAPADPGRFTPPEPRPASPTAASPAAAAATPGGTSPAPVDPRRLTPPMDQPASPAATADP